MPLEPATCDIITQMTFIRMPRKEIKMMISCMQLIHHEFFSVHLIYLNKEQTSFESIIRDILNEKSQSVLTSELCKLRAEG